jgi:hypothetical protein
VSVAAGRVGAGVFVVVVAYLIAGAAVVAWAVRGPGCVCSVCGSGITGGLRFEEFGNLEAGVGSARAGWFISVSAKTVLVEYRVEFSSAIPCVGAEVVA